MTVPLRLLPLAAAACLAVRASAVPTSSFGGGYDGEDATECLQAALDSAAAVVELDARDWVTRPLRIRRHNLTLKLADGARLVAKRGEYRGVNDCLLQIDRGVTNVTICGEGDACLEMHRVDYADTNRYAFSEWRHALAVYGATNVTIRNVAFLRSGGDGIYVNDCRGVHLTNVVCGENYRQGMSVISAEDMTVVDSRFEKTAGTPPQCGVDLEPNLPENRLKDILFERCRFDQNVSHGLLIHLGKLNARSEPLSVVFRDCRSGDNWGRGYVLSALGENGAADSAVGSVTFDKCAGYNHDIDFAHLGWTSGGVQAELRGGGFLRYQVVNTDGQITVSTNRQQKAYWADAAAAAAEAADGKTRATGFATIQAAMNHAVSGDFVFVAPGVYAAGSSPNADNADDVASRVNFLKPLTVVGVEGAAATHIVGRFGSGAGGSGADAVRCVRFASASAGVTPSVLKGFTIRGGGCLAATATEHGGDSDAGQPGGVACHSANFANAYVVDCVISNCVGVRGGLIRFGTYVRCRFSRGHGLAGNSLGRGMTLVNCLVDDFGDESSILLDGVAIVNTTFANLRGVPYNNRSATIPLYNCVISATGVATAAATTGTACNCVFGYEVCADRTACVMDEPYPLFAPLVGDFRLRTGSHAEGIGDAAHVAAHVTGAPAVVEPFKSMDGVTVAATGRIQPGCFQRTVTPAGGAVQASAPVSCAGFTGAIDGLYAFAERPQAIFTLRGAGEATVQYAKVDAAEIVPDMDDGISIVAPPCGVVTGEVHFAQSVLYVAPDGRDAADRGQSPELPLRTLQYAVNRASGLTLVRAAPGDYREGGAVAYAHSNRVVISGRNVRLKGAGRGRSTIWGASDGEAVPAADGMGPAAMRCVVLTKDCHAAVQGFTLRHGRADYSPVNDSANQFNGGLFFSNDVGGENGCGQIVDCELVDGRAFRGSLGFNGKMVRSIARDIPSLGGGAARCVAMESCLVYGNGFADAVSSVNNDCPAYQCTFVDAITPVMTVSGFTGRNCIVVRPGLEPLAVSSPPAAASNNVFSGFAVDGGIGANLVVDDVGFADVANDFRLRGSSPVWTAQFAPADGYWRHSATDAYGRPLIFANGRIIPGAVQSAVREIIVDRPQYGTFSHSGTNLLGAGDSLTVTYAAGPERAALALSVNGVRQATGEMSLTFAVGEAFGADGSFACAPLHVAACYSPDWYVDAENGNDANDGLSPDTAWRTLARLASAPVAAGDWVHAAPGDYDEGTVEQGFVFASSDVGMPRGVPARCEVPSGVTLVADAGNAVTFITGARATIEADARGNGLDAVRCVLLNNGAILRGFTLRDGHTCNAATAESDPYMGGGVAARSARNAPDCGRVYGCVITNCAAQRGGGACGGRIINTRIVDCDAAACSPAAVFSWLLGCFCDGLGQYQAVRNCNFVSHCVFGPNGQGSAACGNLAAGAVVENSVFLMPQTALDPSAEFSHCVFVALDPAVPRDNLASCYFADTVDAVGLNAAGRPRNARSMVVDAARFSAACAEYCEEADIEGRPRVRNGCPDIGCVEFGWPGSYLYLH